MRVTRTIGIIVAAAVLAAVPAAAQDAPARFYEVVRALYAKAGSPGTDEAIRVVNFQVAEQMAFEFPEQGWGMKKSGNGNPPSKGCTARVAEVGPESKIVRGVCYDWITGNSTVMQPAIFNDIPGQVFIPVTPRDHLGATPPPPPPSDTVTRAQLDEAILTARGELHTFLWNEIASELQQLRLRISRIETDGAHTPGGTEPPPAGGDTLAVLREQLVTSKAILELLKKTASRFGVQ